MRRLLTSTAALSIALAPMHSWPVQAQSLTGNGSVVADDGTILCEPSEGVACNLEDYLSGASDAAAAQAEAEAQAAAEAQAQAEAEAQAAAEAQAQAEAEAAQAAEEQAAAEAAAQAEAEAQAAAEAQAQAEAEAAQAAEEQAAAEAAAQAEAEAQAAAEAQAQAEAEAAQAAEEQAAAEAAAQAEAEAQAAAEAQAEAEAAQAAEEQAAAEAEAAQAAEEQAAKSAEEPAAPAPEEPALIKPFDETTGEVAPAAEETEGAAVAQPEADTTLPDEGAVTAEDPATTEAEQVTAPVDAPEAALVEKTPEELAAEAAALEAAQQELVTDESGALVDPAAGLKTEIITPDPNAEPVEVPEVTETEVETLTGLLAEPEVLDPAALEAAATLAPTESSSQEASAEPAPVLPVAEAPVSPEAVDSVITVLTEGDTRSSSQEFAPAPVQVAPGKKDRLSDLEKVGLFALGALAIGAIIKNANDKQERQVVSNTGDRVVVLNPDGSYSVYKDDDTVLRRPGSTVRTETFRDGSTRTIVERTDGSQVVTIRDATGRVLRRAAYDRLGNEMVLIDDLAEEEPVVVTRLPKPRPDRMTISLADENAALKAKLAAREATKLGRTFSLRQVRDIPEVRALAATVDAGNVTFDSGSAAIKAGQADALADLGTLMQDLLAENPAEVFLIEGHTDAVGRAAMNLALSDRRAESVALALTEYFDIPPENMVVQGYGEAELLVPTEADERRNRRVAVRVITPLLRSATN